MSTPDTTTTRRNPWPRRLLIATGVFLLTVLLAIVAVRVLLATSIGRNFVEQRVEALSPSGLSIRIEGLDGDLLSDWSVGEIVLSDPEGEFARLTNVDIDWAPFALVGRTLRMDEISIGTAEFYRQPALQPSAPRGDSSGGAFIRKYRLPEVRIGRLDISDEIAEAAVPLSLVAGVLYQDGRGEIELDMRPVGEGRENIAVDLSWSPRTPLTGTFDLTAPDGGVISTLLGLQGQGDLSAYARAEGKMEDWQATVTSELGGAPILDLSGRGVDRRVTIDGTARFAPLVALVPALERFGEDGRINATLTRPTPRETGSLQAEITTERLTLAAFGTLPRGDLAFPDDGLAVEIETSDLPRLIALDLIRSGAARLTGRIFRNEDGNRFDGTLDASNLDAAGAQLATANGQLSLDMSDGQLAVSSTLDVTGLALPSDQATALVSTAERVRLDLTTAFSGPSVTLDFLGVEGQGLALTASGPLVGDGGLDLSGRLLTRRLSSLTGGQVGRAELDWRVDRTEAGNIRVAASGPVSQLRELPFPASSWVEDTANASARLVIVDGSPVFEDFALTTDGLEVSANGRFANGTLDLDGTLNAEPAVSDAFSLGQLSADFTVSGPVDALQVTADARLAELTAAGTTASTITLASSTTITSGTIATTLDLAAEDAAGAPFSLAGNVGLDGANWSASELELAWGDLSGAANLSGEGGNLDAISGTARLTGKPPLSGLPFERVDARLNTEGRAVTLAATVEGLAAASFTLPDARLTARYSGSELTYTANVSGTGELRGFVLPVSLELDGEGSLVGGSIQTATSLNASVGDITLSSRQPVEFARADGTTTLNAPLALLGGELTLDASLGSGERQITIEGTPLQLRPVLELLARPGLSGTARLRASLSATGDAPLRGRASVTLRDLETDSESTPNIDIDLVSLLEDELEIALIARGEAGLRLNADASAPAGDGPLGYNTAAMSIRADGSGPLETLWAYFGLPDTRLSGRFNLVSSTEPSLGLEGTRAQLTVNGAQFEHGELGLVLNAINLDASYAEGRLDVANLSAEGREGGTVRASGGYTLGQSGEFSARFDRLIAVRRRGLSATLTGDISYERQPESGLISGTLTLDDGRINLEQLPAGGPVTLDVRFPSANGEDEQKRTDPTPTRLNVELDAPRRIMIEGRGVNAELAMDTTISGTLEDPRLEGRAEIVRGDVEFAGRQFRFVDSEVTVNGDPSEAQLNLRAERQTPEFTAIVRVTGEALSPNISLSSTPELPEDEILSRVLFGRSPAELTAFETAQLAAALASMAGGGGFNLTGSLQDALGLDRVSFGQNESGAATLTTGKYLSEDVYLEVETAASGVPGVSIEWTPLNNVEVDSTIDPINGPEVAIRWKREYD